jgi:hypothetical protein
LYFSARLLFSEELSVARILIHGINYAETQRRTDWAIVSVDRRSVYFSPALICDGCKPVCAAQRPGVQGETCDREARRERRSAADSLHFIIKSLANVNFRFLSWRKPTSAEFDRLLEPGTSVSIGCRRL